MTAPSPVLLGEHEPNTPEWYALRAQGIGASEIAAVVGLSPYESAFALWHRKAGNLSGPDPSNQLFYWGHALEPLVATRFREGHDEFAAIGVGTYRHADRAWQIANVDRVLYETGDWYENRRGATVTGVLEIKTTRYPDGWGGHRSSDIPLHVRCQVMQQMDVMGVGYAWVAALIGGNDYREYRIDFDEDDAAALRTAGAAFWESLQTSDEPPVDASIYTYEAVREINPLIDKGTEFEIPAEWWEAVSDSRQRIDQGDADYRLSRSRILNAAGAANFITVNGQRVARRQLSGTGTPYLREIA